MDTEYLKKRHEKNGTSMEELEVMYKQFSGEGNEFGIDAEKMQSYIRRRFASYYAKIDRQPVSDFKGVILGFNVTDYGATGLYNKHKKLYAKEPMKAISGGYTDQAGNPTYTEPDFKKGKPIEPEEARTKLCLAIAKTEEDKEYKVTEIRVGNNFLDKATPLWKTLNFKAGVNKQKSNEKMYTLVATDVTDFKAGNDLSDDQASALIEKFFKSKFVKISNMVPFFDELTDDQKKKGMFFVKGDVVSIIKSDGMKKNMVALNAFDGEDDLITPSISCLFDNEVEIDFDERAQDVIIMGRLWKGQDSDEVVMSAMGFFCSSKYKIEEKPEPIKDNIEEEKPTAELISPDLTEDGRGEKIIDPVEEPTEEQQGESAKAAETPIESDFGLD